MFFLPPFLTERGIFSVDAIHNLYPQQWKALLLRGLAQVIAERRQRQRKAQGKFQIRGVVDGQVVAVGQFQRFAPDVVIGLRIAEDGSSCRSTSDSRRRRGVIFPRRRLTERLFATSIRHKLGTQAQSSAIISKAAVIAPVSSSGYSHAKVAEASRTRLIGDPHRDRPSTLPNRRGRLWLRLPVAECAAWPRAHFLSALP